MTIKEIVRRTAVLLDRMDVKEYLDNGASSASEETAQAVCTLTELANIVISELAESYIPAVKSEEILTTNNRVYYRNLEKTPLKILKVKNPSGLELNFIYSPEYITVNAQRASVEYEYLPEAYGLEDEICYEEKDVSSRVLAYGLAAEYSIVTGEFNQAVNWHKRYTDGIAAKCLPENKNLKARSFV